MRKIIAFLLYFLVVLWVTLGTLYALSVNQWLFDRDFYNGILSNPGLYEDDVALPIVVTGMANEVSGDPHFFETYPNTVDALTEAIQAILPEGYVEDEVRGAADTILAYIEGDARTLSLEFDLIPVKTALSDGGQEVFAATLAERLPLCRGRQQASDSGNILPDCRQSDEQSEEQLRAQILGLLPGYLTAMPDSFELSAGASFKDIATAVKAGTTIGLVVAFLLLLADARLAGRRRRGWLIWCGLLLLLPALVVLSTGFGVRMGMTDSMVREGTTEMEFMFTGMVIPQEFRDALEEAVINAGVEIAQGFLVVGLLAVLVALGLMGTGVAMPHHDPFQD